MLMVKKRQEEARRTSLQIDTQLKQFEAEKQKEKQVLLVGLENSGKTTFFRFIKQYLTDGEIDIEGEKSMEYISTNSVEEFKYINRSKICMRKFSKFSVLIFECFPSTKHPTRF